MAKPDIGTMIVDGELYTLIGVAEFNHIIREVPYNVELFVKKIHENMISRDVLIQRTPDQWSNKMKSRLIESVLKNYQIGVILTACGRSESQCYTVNSLIDGLQRATALVDYIDNKYALSRDAPPIKCRWKNASGNIIERTFNISGKKFNAFFCISKMLAKNCDELGTASETAKRIVKYLLNTEMTTDKNKERCDKNGCS